MLLLASLFVSILGLAQSQCPYTYSGRFGKCYKTYIGTGINDFTSANEFCAQDGASLWSHFDNGLEPKFVQKISSGYGVLVGMRCLRNLDDIDDGGRQCTWVDGSAATRPITDYTNRGAGECVIMTPEYQSYNVQFRFTNCDVGAAAFTCQMPQKKVCPDNFVLYRDQCIFVSATQKTFKEAEDDCVSQKGHLISIRNKPDNNIVQDYAFHNLRNGIFLVGLRNFANGSSWSDNSTVDYTNYAANQTTGECVVAIISSSLGRVGQWAKVSCEDKNYYMCATPASQQ